MGGDVGFHHVNDCRVPLLGIYLHWRRMLVVVLSVVALAGVFATDAESRHARHHKRNSNSAIEAIGGVPMEGQRPVNARAIPVPSTGLLEPQPEPACEFPAEVDPKSDGSDRAKLDYERLCYKHAEIVVRSRLQLLQEAVADTIKALNNIGTNSGLVPVEGKARPAEGATIPAESPAKTTVDPTTSSGVVQALPHDE